MKKIDIKQMIKITYILILAISISLVACDGPNNVNETATKVNKTGFIVTKAGMYDSSDERAVIVKKDSENKSITFYNRIVGREYTLKFDGTSKIYDKYGSSMSMEQIAPGNVVDITFLKSKKLLNTMTISPDAWVYSEVSEFNIDEKTKSMSINGAEYKLDTPLFIFSEDKEAEIMDINSVDRLIVTGVDKKVSTIIIDEGHGYLRLKNEDYFLGGWIEIGSRIIKRIDEDLLIAVPIGSYEVRLSADGIESQEMVTINKNQETEIDLSKVEIEETVSYGNLIIVTDPDEAKVYIDGKEVDTSVPQKLEYGIHQVIAKSDGYQSLTQYIKVGQENATLELNLDESVKPVTPNPEISPIPSEIVTDVNSGITTPAVSPSPTISPVPNSSVSGNTLSATVLGRKVTISTPVDAEVYVNGKYTGVAPISFAKEKGNHEITLRKDGYVTRSYTISLDSSDRDETFSFSDLEKE